MLDKKDCEAKDYSSQKEDSPHKNPSGTDEPPPYTEPDTSPLLPTKEQTIAHLKLLHAFSELKSFVIHGTETHKQREKRWQLYVTVAVRRFNIFVSALKFKYPKTEDVEAMNLFVQTTLPPLDVLMVWHSFLLVPKSFYANFTTNGFKQFTLCPFPLVQAANAFRHGIIGEKQSDWVFEVTDSAAIAYSELILDYYQHSEIDERFYYDPYYDVDASLTVSISCPSCGTVLGETPLSYINNMNEDIGFASGFFFIPPSNKCKCFVDTYVSHSLLRRLLLTKDSTGDTILNPVVRYYDQVKMNGGGVDIEQADRYVKELTMKAPEFYNITDLRYYKSYLNKLSLCVLRDYDEINLISATIPTATKVIIREDLVACVMRQGRFIQKTVGLSWLQSDYLSIAIDEAMVRYDNFFSLAKSASHMLVPTLDIDLIWHTHLLDQERYFHFSRLITGILIDHPDKVEENRLNESFEKTCKLYKSVFGLCYTACRCQYCTINWCKGLFAKEPRSPLIHTEFYSIEHISAHNSVYIITDETSEAYRQTLKKYSLNSILTAPYGSTPFPKVHVTNPGAPCVGSQPHTRISLYLNGCEFDNPDPASAGNAPEERLTYKPPAPEDYSYLDGDKGIPECRGV